MWALTNIGSYPQGFVRWLAVKVERHALTPRRTGEIKGESEWIRNSPNPTEVGLEVVQLFYRVGNKEQHVREHSRVHR
jgi:hypothetical protein